MMLLDLKESIAGYERALSVHVDTVYGYGLAVALDRDKQGMRARAVAKTYAKSDSGNALERDGTFFVPPGERFYYVAMREEGLGDYRGAIKAYEDFLRLLPTSPWAEQARQNIKELRPKAAKQPAAKHKPTPIKGFSWGP
jgi:tetratricopeptide (TPR) repeat protein